MPAIRLVIDKKNTKRYLEAYNLEGSTLLASRGDLLAESACGGEIPATNAQCDTITKLVVGSGEGIAFELAEDGSLLLLTP